MWQRDTKGTCILLLLYTFVYFCYPLLISILPNSHSCIWRILILPLLCAVPCKLQPREPTRSVTMQLSIVLNYSMKIYEEQAVCFRNSGFNIAASSAGTWNHALDRLALLVSWIMERLFHLGSWIVCVASATCATQMTVAISCIIMLHHFVPFV